MIYPARWKRITVDQSKVLKKFDCSYFLGATQYIAPIFPSVQHKIIEEGSILEAQTNIYVNLKQKPMLTSSLYSRQTSIQSTLWGRLLLSLIN